MNKRYLVRPWGTGFRIFAYAGFGDTDEARWLQGRGYTAVAPEWVKDFTPETLAAGMDVLNKYGFTTPYGAAVPAQSEIDATDPERAVLDDIFYYDSSNDQRQPPPLTAADKARLAALQVAAEERVARQRAWAEQEAWENPS